MHPLTAPTFSREPWFSGVPCRLCWCSQPGEWVLICRRLGMYLSVQFTDLEAVRRVNSDMGMWGISARVLTWTAAGSLRALSLERISSSLLWHKPLGKFYFFEMFKRLNLTLFLHFLLLLVRRGSLSAHCTAVNVLNGSTQLSHYHVHCSV